MSLINEALKKAQRARHPPGEGGLVDPMATELSGGRPRVQPRSELRTWVLIGVGAVAGLAAVVAIVVVLMTRSPAPSPVTAALEPASPAITPAPVVTEPTKAPDDSAAPRISAVEQPAPEPLATISALPSAAGTPIEPAVTLSDAAPAASAPAAAPASPTHSALVYEYIDRLRVTGIRASDTDPKVLMNDRVYRVGDLVNRSLGLRLSGIQSSQLTFTDESGAVYTKDL
jgi:hypothetical protein